MPTVLDLQKKRGEIAEKRVALTKVERALTTEERKSFDDMGAEFNSLRQQIADLEAAEADAAEVRRVAPRIDQPAPVGGGNGVVASVVKVGEDRSRRDPCCGFESVHELLTCVRRSNRGEDKRLTPLRGALGDEKEQPGYAIPNGFLAGLSRQSKRGMEYRTVGSDEQQTGSNPYGGFLVPQGFLPTLLSVAAEDTPVLGMLTRIPMATPSVGIPARTDKLHTTSVSGGLQFYRRSETTQATASRVQLEKITLTAGGLVGLAYATEELMADSAISMTAIIEAGFRDELAATLMSELMLGNGNGGELEGIVNCPAAVSVTRASANQIKHIDVVTMRSRAWGYRNCIWLANHDTYPQLAQMSLAVGTGGSAAYQTSIVEDRPDLLLGRPIYYTEFCATLGTVGDIVCFNPTQYLFGEYLPMQTASSIHVRFDYLEQCFRFWARNCGACWWRSALTPRNSTATLSPIVTLT